MNNPTAKTPNKEQLKAINYFDGPSLVIAGAGTGKTFVLTEKIKKIVVDKKIDPQNVLALTFTDKAAYEMEERVDQALPYGYFQSWIMTFHSFADRILREYGVHIGLSPSFKILSEAEATLFFRTNLNHFNLNYFYSTGNPTGFVQGVLNHFSRLRDENISSQEYLTYAKEISQKAKTIEEKQEAEKTLELVKIYQQYEKLKLKANFLDFSDLIYYLVKLLEKRKNVLRALQKQFQYCLVDEFQDTNIVQYDLLKLLFPVSRQPQLTVIGDDNQSIYKFRGASVSNILNYMKDYDKARMFVLNQNYRSYQEILEGAYQLITHNNPDTLESKMGISKKLVAVRGANKKAKIELLSDNEGDQEAESVVKKILNLTTRNKYLYHDIAILVRANDYAKPAIQALERYGIPYQFLGPALLYYKNEVRDLIALLNFLNNPNDSTSLYRVLSIPYLELNEKDLVYLMAFTKRISRSLYETIDLIVQIDSGESSTKLKHITKSVPLLKVQTKKGLVNLFNVIEELFKKINRVSAIQILYDFLDQTGYLKKLSEIKTKKDEERLNNITRFFNRLKKMEGEVGEVSVREAVDNIILSLEVGDSPRAEDFNFEQSNAVNILTAHSAKGLEFPVVFLTNLVRERFPTRRRREQLPIPEPLIKETLPEGDYHLQEERRLFYVGLTRARDKIFLSYADFYGAGKRQRKISPFILETLGVENLTKAKKERAAQAGQLSIFELGVKKPEPILKKLPEEYGIKRYSYSQIETYERCPKQYEYRYLIKVPEPESSALSFGSSVHQALERFYQDVRQGLKPKEKNLLTYFEENFIPFGYLNKQQRVRAVEHGKTILSHYYQEFYSDKAQVISVEQFFVIKFNQQKQQYLVSGKIDRIDKIAGRYQIIDYKTGKKPADYQLKKSLQLGIYALAAMDKDLFGLRLEQIDLIYYFLEKGEQFLVKATDRDLNVTKEKVLKSLAKIEKGKYTTNVGRHCDWCAFKIICPAWNS